MKLGVFVHVSINLHVQWSKIYQLKCMHKKYWENLIKIVETLVEWLNIV